MDPRRQLSICVGLSWTPLPRCAVTARGRPASWSASRVAKIVPKSATPNAPPMLRKNVADAVATPTSSGRASFWTASTSTCMTRPSPTPTTTMYAEATQGGVSHAEQREQEHADHENRRAGNGNGR